MSKISSTSTPRVQHRLARPVIWSDINRIAETLLETGVIGSGEVFRRYLAARNPAQQPLDLDWLSAPDRREDESMERLAA
jgi:hypothetical protein